MRLMAGNSPCRTPSGPLGPSWNVYKIASVLPPEKKQPAHPRIPSSPSLSDLLIADKARRKTAFAEEPGRPPPLPPRRQT